jgi:hypothetical protein
MSATSTVVNSTSQNGVAVLPGGYAYASAWFLTAVSARTVSVGIAWYTSAGAQVGSTVFGPTATDGTVTWVQCAVSAIAPATAAFAVPVVQVASTGGASEVHYVDDVVIVGDWW